MGLFGSDGEESEQSAEEVESESEEETDEVPIPEQLPVYDDWEEEDGHWVVRYDTELHIPFTRVEAEFGFINSNPKTIEFDNLPRVENPQNIKVGEVTREEYYTVDMDNPEFFAERDRVYEDGRLHIAPRLNTNKNPELTLVPANNTYKQIVGETQMAIVVECEVAESTRGVDEDITWTISEEYDVYVAERGELDSLQSTWPSDGAATGMTPIGRR